jgi:hypothetical protein
MKTLIAYAIVFSCALPACNLKVAKGDISEGHGTAADCDGGDAGSICADDSDCAADLSCIDLICESNDDGGGGAGAGGGGAGGADPGCSDDDDCAQGEICGVDQLCAVPTCEQLDSEADCIARPECEPIYAGVDCSCGANCTCQPGEAGCICASFEFFKCEQPAG